MHSRFAVIGNPISHSLSPVIHHYFAEETGLVLTYEKITGEEAHFAHQVGDFFQQGGKGLNVTLPFKGQAFALARHTTTRCQLAGTANTLWMQEGQLYADNTDGIGFLRDVMRYRALDNTNILLLGAGGAARGIIPVLLARQGIQVTVVNRSYQPLEQLVTDFPSLHMSTVAELVGPFDLIINATAASLDGAAFELPQPIMAAKPFCYDLAYHQKEKTAFIRYAHAMGCDGADGLGMLVEQAAEAFYLWNHVRPSVDKVLAFLGR